MVKFITYSKNQGDIYFIQTNRMWAFESYCFKFYFKYTNTNGICLEINVDKTSQFSLVLISFTPTQNPNNIKIKNFW
jgi:hypothetical protein